MIRRTKASEEGRRRVGSNPIFLYKVGREPRIPMHWKWFGIDPDKMSKVFQTHPTVQRCIQCLKFPKIAGSRPLAWHLERDQKLFPFKIHFLSL